MVYGRYIYSIHGVYKPTNITGGAPPCTTHKHPWKYDQWPTGTDWTSRYLPLFLWPKNNAEKKTGKIPTIHMAKHMVRLRTLW